MLTLEFDEHKKIDKIYEQIVEVFMSKKNHSSFKYKKTQHHIPDNPELDEYYYNEFGEVYFKNSDGNDIKLTIYRMHPHKHNGWGGLNGNPIIEVTISDVRNENEKILWSLNVESGTLHYKARISSMEIPYELLNETSLDKFIEKDEIKPKEIKQEKSEIEVEKKETIFLLEQLNGLTNYLNELEDSKKQIEYEMNNKIEAATRGITQSYSTGIQETSSKIVEVRKQIHEFYSAIAKYSTFDADLIGYAFEIITSTIENCDYVYKNILHNYTKRVHGNIDSWDEEEETYMDVIVKADQAVSYYESSYDRKDKIDKLLDSGEILKINEYISPSFKKTNITFYSLEDEKLISNINFGKFSYLKAFIDSLIEYRILNNIEELTKEEMNAFIQKYFNDTREALLRNLMQKSSQKMIKLMISV